MTLNDLCKKLRQQLYFYTVSLFHLDIQSLYNELNCTVPIVLHVLVPPMKHNDIMYLSMRCPEEHSRYCWTH